MYAWLYLYFVRAELCLYFERAERINSCTSVALATAYWTGTKAAAGRDGDGRGRVGGKGEEEEDTSAQKPEGKKKTTEQLVDSY